MKTKLLLLTLLISSVSFSQTISSFTSDPSTSFTIMTPVTSIDQTPVGMGTSWTFSNLNTSGTNIDTYAAPTGTELVTYPGTTEVLSITTQGATPITGRLFLKNDGSGTSFTGAEQGDIQLNYSGANAFIGLFPLNFGSNNSNPVSGTFSYQGTNGTFTGTATATVDAYGTLNISDNSGGNYSGTVTRLRVDQVLSFSIPPIFNNIGSLTQTTYYYHDNSDNNIAFRYNSAALVSAFLGIDQTTETYEGNTNYTLSTDGFENTISLNIYPNPTQELLHISINDNHNLSSIRITDNLGRIVFTSNQNLNTIDVKNLNSGIYVISIITESGKRVNKKFIKK